MPKFNPDPVTRKNPHLKPMSTASHVAYQKAQTLMDKLAEFDFDVIAEIVGRYRDPRTPGSSKDAMLTLLCDRAYPKLRATEVTHMGGEKAPATIINIVAGNLPPTYTDVEPISLDNDTVKLPNT